MLHSPYSLGIQDFRELRITNRIYVDKTLLINELLQGKTYFYSHPRRFGKSLLLSTLKYLFQGKKELFEGLWIADKIKWEEFNYPVLHFSFIESGFREVGIQKYMHSQINSQAADHGIELKEESVSDKIRELVQRVANKNQQKVVFLVDEYDKPIVEYLRKDELPTAEEHKKWLRMFYSPLKELDPYLRFVFITGVSKFSKVSLFSDLNQLQDITLQSKYATLLGYTEAEIDYYFQNRLQEIAVEQGKTYNELYAEMRKWYNGYSWNGKDKVYNPTSMLNFLDTGEFKNYWFETGTPTFLIEMLQGNFQYNLEEVEADMDLVESFRLEALHDITLLFQTGYLTIKEKAGDVLTLVYPNQEVRNSMTRHLLRAYSKQENVQTMTREMYKALTQRNFEQLFKVLRGLFGAIPYQIFDAHQEKYYHAIIFLTFKLMGYYAQAEPSVSEGRIDVVVETEDAVFLMEFKVNGTIEEAMQQIHDKKYYQRYEGTTKEVYLIGVVCKEKTIKEFRVERRA